MPEGGTLTIALANVDWVEDDKQRPDDCRPGRYVMLSIADTGSGMTPTVAARVSDERAETELLRKPYRAHELAQRIGAMLEG